MRQNQRFETRLPKWLIASIKIKTVPTGFKRQGWAFLIGVLTAFAQAPFHLLPVCFITFPLLLWLIDGIDKVKITPLRQIFLTALLGWSFGFGYFFSGLWWIGYLMLTDGSAFGVMMLPLAALGLPAMMAVYYALALVIATRLARHGYARLLALAIGFGLAEWLRGVLFTGFPWNAISYSAMVHPLLMQIASLVGLYGVNALAVLIYATPILFFDRKTSKNARIAGISIAISLVGLIIAFGFWRLSDLPEIDEMRQSAGTRVRLIQPSIAQQEKIDDDNRFKNFSHHLQLTTAPPAPGHPLPDLIVWSETSVPYILAYVREARESLAKVLMPGQLLLAGTVRAEIGDNPAKPNYYNSLEVINEKGETIDHADKAHLVPFGEYLPWPELFHLLGLHAAAEMTGGYSTAAHHVSLRLNEEITILPLICYEIIFPTEMTYQGEQANVLLNISNDAWYGVTPGPWQHFHQARLRAVEQGMPLVRGANNGISAIVDAYGRIVAMLNLNEVGFIDATIPPAIAPIWPGGANEIQLFGMLAIFLAAIFFQEGVSFWRIRTMARRTCSGAVPPV